MRNIAIIGAGAAGLFAAKMLSADTSLRITVFEKAQKVGTKLRASGGGRANLMNTQIAGSCYNQPDFIDDILKTVDYKVIKSEFEKMGLRLSTDEEGRVYPATLFSQTVIDVLLQNLGENVQIITDYEVKKLQKYNEKWQINDGKTLYDAVLLSSGSPAGMIAKNRQNYNGYLSDLKIKHGLRVEVPQRARPDLPLGHPRPRGLSRLLDCDFLIARALPHRQDPLPRRR